MACQTVEHVNTPRERADLTMRRMKDATIKIKKIERAKELVCGVISVESQKTIRNILELLLPLLDEGIKWLRSGALDELDDEKLKTILGQLQTCDRSLTFIIKGSVEIGLEAIEPFPKLLSQLRAYHGAVQSQIEGIILSLNGTFQGLVKGSAEELIVSSKG